MMDDLILPPSATAEFEQAFDEFAANFHRGVARLGRAVHDATHETELNHDQLIEVLWQDCVAFGSRKAWADAHEVSPQYVTDVLKGRRDPGDKILKGLGFEPVKRYRKVIP